jgi:hypothetical protein
VKNETEISNKRRTRRTWTCVANVAQDSLGLFEPLTISLAIAHLPNHSNCSNGPENTPFQATTPRRILRTQALPFKELHHMGGEKKAKIASHSRIFE